MKYPNMNYTFYYLNNADKILSLKTLPKRFFNENFSKMIPIKSMSILLRKLLNLSVLKNLSKSKLNPTARGQNIYSM